MPTEVEAGLARLGAAWSDSVAGVGIDEIMERATTRGSQPFLVDHPATDHPARAAGRPRRLAERWLLAAACTAFLIAGVVTIAQRKPDDPSPVETGPTTASSVPTGSSTTLPTPEPFVGIWVSIDTDGSTQTMEVVRSAGTSYVLVLRDPIATAACAGSAATMTGTGLLETEEELVIARPALSCDDGSTPRLGAPPQAELADFALELDTDTGELVDSFGVVWRRDGASPSASAPSGSIAAPTSTTSETAPWSQVSVPGLGSAASGGMWPQSALREVRSAQELADAGDPSATWQLDAELAADEEPWGAELFARFIEEGLGWEEFTGGFAGSGYVTAEGGGHYESVVFIRCAPGMTNPLSPVYAEMPPEIRTCAPTIDDQTYETVAVSVRQPERRGPTGIWVVDRWEIRESRYEANSLWGLIYPEFEQVVQVVPPSDAEVTALLQTFLEARLDGAGAEQHLLREPEGSPFADADVPLLYATTSGVRYRRFEIQRLQGPVWPTAWTEYEVRLFAHDETVVEQHFHVVTDDGELGLVYGHASDEVPTREDGQPVPVPYRVLDDEVTFAAAPPWDVWHEARSVVTLAGGRNENLVIALDPKPEGRGCARGAAAVDAEALARSITADRDFTVVETSSVRIAGADALQLDMAVATTSGSVCLWDQWVLEAQPAPDIGYSQWRMRLYLIDAPGELGHVVAVAIIAPASQFERVLQETSAIVESLELHSG